MLTVYDIALHGLVMCYASLLCVVLRFVSLHYAS